MGWDRGAQARTERARLLGGCGRNILGLALAGVIIAALYYFVLTPVAQFITAPWSMGWDGGPTMTGSWVGPLRSKWGGEYHLYLTIEWEPPSLRRRGSRRSGIRADLVGTARICNRAGKEFRLEVDGDADRSASDVRIDAEARDSRYRESLPLRGAWHGDTLDLSAFTSPFGPEGELRGARSTVSSTTTDQAGLSSCTRPA